MVCPDKKYSTIVLKIASDLMLNSRQLILPAPPARGLCPGSAGRMEEDWEPQVEEDCTAPDPQRWLHRKISD